MSDIPFSDFGLKWFEDIVNKIIEWFTHTIVAGYEAIRNGFFGTPLPDGEGAALVFGVPAPSDEPWHSIHEAVVAGEIMIFALLVLFLVVQARHFIRIFNVSSAYEERRTKRSAWVGAVLIVAWYWVAVLMLYFVDGLTIALIPDLSVLGATLVDLLPLTAGNPGLTLVMAVVGGLSMVTLKAIYFIREVLLYVYLYGMPFGIAIAFGNVPVMSTIAKRLCRQFIPLAILPLPAAVLFRGYELLFAGEPFITPNNPFLQYLVVISLPLIALYVTWKTFTYASPLTAKILGTTSKAAATIGAVAATGYLAGPWAATTTARWGVRAGTAQAAAQRVFGGSSAPESSATQSVADGTGTTHDNVADDAGGNGRGLPQYRRSENDPAYY